MTEISACQILNQVDQKGVSLCVEWHESGFSIMLLNFDQTVFKGEMSPKDIDYFSDELSKSPDEYLRETKDALRRKNAEIQFFIMDNNFEWKRNNVWTLGRITLLPVLDMNAVSKTLQRVLNSYESIQERLAVLEVENESLQSIKLRLSSDIEDMIRMKTEMEINLYKKFLLLLNSKKAKIRELQRALEKNNKCPAFDASTDEESLEEADDRNEHQKKKQKSNYGSASIIKLNKTDLDGADSCDESEKRPSPQASTSKHFLSESKGNVTIENKNTSDRKLNVSTTKNNRLSFYEECSDDDMFA